MLCYSGPDRAQAALMDRSNPRPVRIRILVHKGESYPEQVRKASEIQIRKESASSPLSNAGRSVCPQTK